MFLSAGDWGVAFLFVRLFILLLRALYKSLASGLSRFNKCSMSNAQNGNENSKNICTQNYIRPWLFGRDADGASSAGGNTSARKRRRKTPEELMEDMSRSVEKSVASINQELGRVKEEVARTARQDALHREIGAFKADLDAIKGLLLNRCA